MTFGTEDGRVLAYRSIGSGPPLVCHPGGPGFSAAYLGALALDRDFTLILLDPRGTGGSDPAETYETADYDRDFVCGPACADDLASSIPGASRVVLEDCGHFPWVEQPERWREAVCDFLG